MNVRFEHPDQGHVVLFAVGAQLDVNGVDSLKGAFKAHPSSVQRYAWLTALAQVTSLSMRYVKLTARCLGLLS